MDVVYALVIWQVFMLLPRPNFDNPKWDTVGDMLLDEWDGFLVPVLAIAVLIVCWLQNNKLLGWLKFTDEIHTGISIFQLFAVLFYLYALRLGMSVDSAVDTRVLESSAAMLDGAFGSLAWWYAWRKGGLLADNVSEELAQRIAKANFAEPFTALTTIPAAFIGPWFWGISWLFYPVFQWLLKRPSRSK
jgi:hypothetical protein